jgi:hypothetical protein
MAALILARHVRAKPGLSLGLMDAALQNFRPAQTLSADLA